MYAVTHQRGDTWRSDLERRYQNQFAFTKCWLVITSLSVVFKQVLKLAGVQLTRESIEETLEVEGNLQKRELILTHVKVYDDYACVISLGGMLIVLLGQWYSEASWWKMRLSVLRNLIAVLALAAFVSVAQWLQTETAMALSPSGHIALYILTSYQYFHNAKCALIDVGWKPLAILLLVNIPFTMYCSVWTILVFHNFFDVVFAVLYALILTHILHSARLDR